MARATTSFLGFLTLAGGSSHDPPPLPARVRHLVPGSARQGAAPLPTKGFPPGSFKAPLGTEEFRAEYRAFINTEAPTIAVNRAAPGSIDDLVTRCFAVPERLGPTETTQRIVCVVLEKFRAEIGPLPVARVTFEHIEKIIAAKIAKRQVGKRTEGGIQPAKKLRKELVRLFAFAKKAGMHATNPAEDAERVKVPVEQRSDG